MTKTEYLNLKLDSRSSIVCFIKDRMKYYREYVLGRKSQNETNSTRMGNIIEDMLLDADNFENQYALSSLSTLPADNMKSLVEDIYNSILINPDMSFEERFIIAKCKSNYKISKDALLKKFEKEGKQYLQYLIDNTNKKVISVKELEEGRKATERILSTFPHYFEIYEPQVVLESELDGLAYKVMLDIIIKDDNLKEITPIDIKITHNVEGFITNYYLKERLDIQGYLYYHALKTNFPGYIINDFRFIVGDSIGYYAPLEFIMGHTERKYAYEGKMYNGKYYKGLQKTIKELLWAKKTNIFDVSLNNYNSFNKVSIDKYLYLTNKNN